MLKRDKISSEAREEIINELNNKVQEMPNNFRVRNVQTLFRELNMWSTSLSLTLTADDNRRLHSVRCHGSLALIPI